MYGIYEPKPPERMLYRYHGNVWIKVANSSKKFKQQVETLTEPEKSNAKTLFQRCKYEDNRVYSLEPEFIWNVSIPAVGKARVIMH